MTWQQLLSDQDVYVYGLSYGAYLVEGLAHFACQGVLSRWNCIEEWRHSGETLDVLELGPRRWCRGQSIPCMAEDFWKSKFPGVTDLSSTTSWLLLYLTASRELTPVLTH
ncbi:hypothetical protein P3T76_008181 [Phytophthora citrophthora]|uniref:Uncharacterized protein n=1 Tax=Phytophthora citrophthora TaxID=4793 RepID=A0AAD9LLC1_9STRA|nr:hypothetical protein P3T76_008199 [Phytophthora citrophthora]KAK1940730.1 hypothetical protein P3T76_008181 [Phytophthora citrophthora]